MIFYEVSTMTIQRGVYDISEWDYSLNAGFSDTYSAGQCYIGGRPCYSLRYDVSENYLYAKFSQGGEEEVIWDSVDNFTNTAYSYICYPNSTTVNAVWGDGVLTSGRMHRYDLIESEHLQIKSTDGSRTLLDIDLTLPQYCLPKGTPINLNISFNQASGSINCVWRFASMYQAQTNNYRVDYTVLGYSDTMNTTDVKWNINQAYNLSYTLA